MIGKVNRLPVETQKALQEFACLGNSAEIKTLSAVCGTSEQELHSNLWEAVRLEYIGRFEDSYNFGHDRVQEAAYSLIPEQLRAEAHLRIGRILRVHTPADKLEERIFEIVNQFNRGTALITSRAEREELAELNLIAGRRAKASTAYASALKYLVAGAALLGDDRWERRHELIFTLELHRAECEFLTGELAAAEERLTDAFIPRRKHSRTCDRRMLARGSLHDPRSKRPRGRRLSRIPPTSRRRMGAASNRRGSAMRIRADLVTAREPRDRGAR